jgi:RsmE family RNA methyltransferase
VNLVLFESAELASPLPLADPRAQHIIKVLRRTTGDTFVAGVVDGPLGVATLRSLDATSLSLEFAPGQEPPPLPSISLLVGLPRPQTARDLLRDATTLGVARIHFVATERSDPNYASATLWTSGEWRRHLLAGAAQACDTRLPAVTWTRTLASVLASEFPASAEPLCLALDNYEASTPLSAALGAAPSGLMARVSSRPSPLVLAFGPERGWGPADRAALRAAGFTLCSLGSRVLRLETAVTAALSLAHFRAS